MEADYILNYEVLSKAREHQLYLLARIRGKAAAGSRRQPLNVCAVLDRSGSMAGEKLAYVKKAVQFLVQHLKADDRFSLVTYNTTVTVDVRPTQVTYKDAINQSIEAIQWGYGTNLSGGWLQGCQLVAEGIGQNQSDRVLLLTDGLANQGITSLEQLTALARQKRQAGVTTTTIGVGMDFNEDLLKNMAHEGGGTFYFIANPDQTPTIFAEELQDLSNVVGQNLDITLQPTRAVAAVRQLNHYPSEKQGNAHLFHLGDIFAEEVKILLLELSIPALQFLGEVEVAHLRFDYDEIGDAGATHQTVEMPIRVNTVPEEDFTGQQPNAEVTKAALLLRAAGAREEAISEADRGNFMRASKVLKEVADEIQHSKLADSELHSQHDMLREEAVDMGLGSARYDSHTRKLVTTQLFNTQTGRLIRYQAWILFMRQQHRLSRRAKERSGSTPTVMKWNQDQDSRELKDDLVRIGRDEDNDVVIDEEEVSRYHCQIIRDGDSLILHDLVSTNGTFANGGKVEKPFRLSVGDVVYVGSWLFMFE